MPLSRLPMQSGRDRSGIATLTDDFGKPREASETLQKRLGSSLPKKVIQSVWLSLVPIRMQTLQTSWKSVTEPATVALLLEIISNAASRIEISSRYYRSRNPRIASQGKRKGSRPSSTGYPLVQSAISHTHIRHQPLVFTKGLTAGMANGTYFKTARSSPNHSSPTR